MTHCARRTRAEFEKAIQLFIQHSDREEDDVLKSLKAQLSPEENSKLAADFVNVGRVSFLLFLSQDSSLRPTSLTSKIFMGTE